MTSSSLHHLPDIPDLAALLPAFEIEHLIAQSGTSAIYKARQISLDRQVAIKILKLEDGYTPTTRHSFETEAKEMALLTHSNLIRVFDSGEIGDLLYMVMEYVPGKSLHQSAHGKAIDPKQAVGIILEVTEGLAHAHAHGISHQNLCPTRILLTPDAKPKIGSFGLTISADLQAPSPYTAPQSTSPSEQEAFQSDIYAIGTILRELLTGAAADSTEFHQAIIADRKLSDICMKATHPDPSLRFHHISDLSSALTHWNNAKSSKIISAPPSAKPYRPPLTAKQTKYTPKPTSGHSTLLRNCLLIAILLFAIHQAMGYQTKKKEDLIRLQQEQDAKLPTIRVVHLDAQPTATEDSSQALAASDSK